jgi:hypothetical protein
MLLFRSEEHIERWREEWGQPRGEAFTLQQMWGLAKIWYGPDRRDPDWRRYNLEEAQAIFASLGFTSPFWKLGG